MLKCKRPKYILSFSCLYFILSRNILHFENLTHLIDFFFCSLHTIFLSIVSALFGLFVLAVAIDQVSFTGCFLI